MKTEIVYEDNSILVCHKPPGIAVQTSKIGESDVVSELKNYLAAKGQGGRGYLGIVHRLDQLVEGLLVFAKNRKAAAGLTKQLQEGILNKDYIAVVYKKADCELPLEGTLVNEIARSPENRAVVRPISKLYAAEGNSTLVFKEAILHYKMTHASHEESDMQNLFLAEIHIDTGRFHQIRAQLSYAGFPIVGDLKYGDDESVILSRVHQIHNVLLCANKIRFLHPVTSGVMEFKIHPRDPFFTKC